MFPKKKVDFCLLHKCHPSKNNSIRCQLFFLLFFSLSSSFVSQTTPVAAKKVKKQKAFTKISILIYPLQNKKKKIEVKQSKKKFLLGKDEKNLNFLFAVSSRKVGE